MKIVSRQRMPSIFGRLKRDSGAERFDSTNLSLTDRLSPSRSSYLALARFPIRWLFPKVRLMSKPSECEPEDSLRPNETDSVVRPRSSGHVLIVASSLAAARCAGTALTVGRIPDVRLT